MSSPLTISAVIPTYNRAEFVGEAISALLLQTHPVSEIIIWDDGSSDGTSEVVGEFGSRVRYFRAENCGKSGALNLALEQVTSDYVWICDDDDIARPNGAALMVDALSSGGNKITIGGFERFCDDPKGDGRRFFPTEYWPDLSQGCPLRHILEDCFVFQNSMLVHRSCYEEIGRFRDDLARSIDYEMLIRLACRYPITLFEDIVFAQREHGGTRGPAHSRHEASLMEDVWLGQDQIVFRELHASLPISIYEAMFESDTVALERRAALIQRACVYSRRHLWDLALEDFEVASDIGGSVPLSEVEWTACRRSMAGKHNSDLVFEQRVSKRMCALARRNGVGRSIVRGLARGFAWRVRRAVGSGDVTGSVRTARLLGALTTAVSLARHPRLVGERAAVFENKVLPGAAYRW